MNTNLSLTSSDNCIETPFVYEGYLETQELQAQSQFVIEERGDSGTNVFTVAHVFTEAHCDEIMNYIIKHSSFMNCFKLIIIKNSNSFSFTTISKSS